MKKYSIAVLAAVLVLALCTACGAGGKGNNHGIPVRDDAEVLSDEKWVTENEFKIYDDSKYVSVTGIDISEFVGDIDWEQVKDAGIKFAILRVGYRGYETAKFVFDNNLQMYLHGCNEADLPCGAYFVSQAINEAEAEEEAERVLECIHGYQVTMPIYIDLEAAGETARTKDLTREEYTQIVNAFCRRIEKEGHRAGVYSNENWIKAHLNWEELTEWDLWLAKYTQVPSTEHIFNMWQYSASGIVPGAEKECDLNVRVYKK